MSLLMTSEQIYSYPYNYSMLIGMRMTKYKLDGIILGASQLDVIPLK